MNSARTYRKWNFIEVTPMGGHLYHHVDRQVIMVIYRTAFKLYRDFSPDPSQFYPYFADTKMEHVRG